MQRLEPEGKLPPGEAAFAAEVLRRRGAGRRGPALEGAREATMLVLTFGTAALAVAFGRGWGKARIAAWTGWLRSCGRLSYEVYLSHMFIVWPAVWLFRWSGSDLRLGWLWFLPTVALAWLLGWAVDRAISTPADRWLLARLGRPAASRPVLARS